MTNRSLLSLCATSALLAAGCGATQKPTSADAAIYEVTFQGTWTKATHPTDYPEGSSLNPNAAHFSGVIGAAHNPSYFIFKEGAMATPGLMMLSHKGSHSPLDEELKAARAAGNAAETFETGVFFDVTAPNTATFEVSDRFPLVSLVAMIAPSPDWFVGVANLDLKENGRWVDGKTVEAFAWDSGTYEGTTYKVDEKPSDPKQPIAMSSAPPFQADGRKPPIATLTFTRKK